MLVAVVIPTHPHAAASTHIGISQQQMQQLGELCGDGLPEFPAGGALARRSWGHTVHCHIP